MKNVKLIAAIVVSILTLVLLITSCQKQVNNDETIPNGKSKLQLFLTDDPSLIFDSIFIDIRMVEVKVETNSGTEFWDTLNIRPGVYNILKFRNGVDTLLASSYIANGEIKKLRMTLGTNNRVVVNNISSPLIVRNGNNQITINIDDVDRIQANSFRLWIDFDGHGSVIKLNNGQYELKPKIHSFNNNKSGRLKGEIKPSAALPARVMVIAGSDTLNAIPEHDGEFKVRGITTSTVKVIIKPTAPYKDSIINNVQMRSGDDTDLGDIRLHQ